MNDQRAAWEPHTQDGEQLDLFSVESETRGAYDEEPKRVYQITELPGETWQDAFGDAA